MTDRILIGPSGVCVRCQILSSSQLAENSLENSKSTSSTQQTQQNSQETVWISSQLARSSSIFSIHRAYGVPFRPGHSLTVLWTVTCHLQAWVTLLVKEKTHETALFIYWKCKQRFTGEFLAYKFNLWRINSNWKSQNYLHCAGGKAGARGEAHDNFVYVSSLFTPKNWRHFLAELQAFRHLKMCKILDTELLVINICIVKSQPEVWTGSPRTRIESDEDYPMGIAFDKKQICWGSNAIKT